MARRTDWRSWGDIAGMTTSLLCGIHCVVLAWAVTTMPLVWFTRRLWGVSLPVWGRIELGLAMASLSLALVVLGSGWIRHRRVWPLALGVPGAVLVSTVFVLPVHVQPLTGPLLVLAGGVLLVLAHGLNLRFGRLGPQVR